jgi:hypothetical protein
MRRLAGLLLLGCVMAVAWAEERPADPNLDAPAELVTVARGGYTISALVSHRGAVPSYRHGIALFAGHPGILRLREEGGQFFYDLRGNFLVRSRRHWLDDETLVAVVDAPSDQWNGFSQHFRETPRYGEDVAALLQDIGRHYGVAEWTAVGTSEGSISAFHAARMNPQLLRRVILSASVFHPSRNGPGLSGVDWGELKAALLFVHHVDDPCRYTPYRTAENLAEKTRAPLTTVRGAEGVRGNECEAYTQHGFVGVEAETVRAMRTWIKTGAAVPEVSR